MASQRVPFLVAVLTLIIGGGIAIVAFVHAQTGTTVVKTFSGSATLQYGDAGGTVENNVTIHQKVIYLKNTGSDPDTFRTTLPVNPESRCGIKGPAGGPSQETNILPNILPTTLDVPLVVNNPTTYMFVVCVTQGLPLGPFTWSYKTISVGALNAGSEKVIAELQDTVQVTETIPCSDSDGGINFSVKGIATGTYAGAITSHIAIYGQEPDPTSSKTTTDKFSTIIDYCASVAQLNEGFCKSDGSMSMSGIQCPYGCKDGVCVTQSLPSTLPVITMSIEPEFPSVGYRTGLRAIFKLLVADDAPMKNDISIKSSQMRYPVFSDSVSYGCKGVTACSVQKNFYPVVSGEHFITVTVTDGDGKAYAKTVNFTAVACSSDADCGVFTLLKQAAYCGGWNRSNILEYGSQPRCLSNVCDAAGVERVKQICPEGQICGGKDPYAICVPSLSPTPSCTPDAAIRSICMCGSDTYGYSPDHEFYRSYENSGYCCSVNGNQVYTHPGPCTVSISTPRTASQAIIVPASSSSQPTPSPSVSVPTGIFAAPSSPVAPVPGTPPVAPPVIHLAPPQNLPRTQTGSATVQKKVSKAKVRVLKKQQQALRRELRTLERSLLRKKNVAALSQIADLRDALSEINLQDPSAAETLQSLREEIVDLRFAVTKKAKQGG